MLSPSMKGSAFMVFAMAAFTFNDSIVKLLSDDLPIVQIIFLRGVMTTILIGGLVYLNQQTSFISDFSRPVIWMRALMEVGATYAFLTGLKHIPIANAAAILSALPLAVTIGSALFLKEPVGWRRWIAIIVGFCGVLIIVRPGFDGFNTYSFYILVCVVFAATRDLITRQAPVEVSSLILTLSTSVAITITGGILVLFTGKFEAISLPETGGLLTAALFLIVAYYFIVSSMRIGDIAVIAPFRYTNLIWAIIIGIVVFKDPVDWLTFLGSSIVVATGIYTLYRERIRILSQDDPV